MNICQSYAMNLSILTDNNDQMRTTRIWASPNSYLYRKTGWSSRNTSSSTGSSRRRWMIPFEITIVCYCRNGICTVYIQVMNISRLFDKVVCNRNSVILMSVIDIIFLYFNELINDGHLNLCRFSIANEILSIIRICLILYASVCHYAYRRFPIFTIPSHTYLWNTEKPAEAAAPAAGGDTIFDL